MMNSLCYNDDVLVEILLRLPAKSLIRFKSVCRYWLRLISSDQFCHLHSLRRHKPQPSLILHAHNSHFFFYFHPISNAHQLVPYSFNTIPYPKILSSCNGLLLLQSGCQLKSTFYVYNPTTKQSRKISLTISDNYTNVLGLNLAFDPSISLHYKIVCVRAARIPTSDRGRSCQIEVYDSESCKWKICLESFTVTRNANFSTGVHWNNVIHWENHPRSNLYFNIDKNDVGVLPHAVIPWRGGDGGGTACRCQLQESNGHLYHFVTISYHGDKFVAVYELQQDYSKWSLKYHHGIGQLPGKFRILSFIRGDDGETNTLVTHIPGKISAYMFLKSCEELVDLTNQSFYLEDTVQFDARNVHQFVESLAVV